MVIRHHTDTVNIGTIPCHTRDHFFLLGLVALVLSTTGTLAKNVDLSTVPNRDTVQLTIYNSEDLTLVRETRVLTFKAGVNPLQFSWANTLIDPTSVELRFPAHADKLELLDTTFPHDKPQMLYWNVQSELDGEATVEISYFTSGISWQADYVGIADAAEQSMHLESFVRVNNQSGEDYENAKIRLVVGTINLTEKIAQLAQIPMADVSGLAKQMREELRYKAARRMAVAADEAAEAASAGAAPSQTAPKAILKEGLSEYFLYTVEGTETIPTGWSKRMRSFDKPRVPIRVQYRYRPAEYGDQLVRLYLLRNDQDSTLGETPLPDGMVRLFRDNGRGGLSYVASQSTKYIPIGDKFELNLGPDPEVIFQWVKLRSWRSHIWIQLVGGGVHRRVDDGKIEIDVHGSVSGWDDHSYYAQRIRNYTDKPIEVEVRRTLPGHIHFRTPFDALLHDYQTVQYTAQVEPGERLELRCEIVQHQGATPNRTTSRSCRSRGRTESAIARTTSAVAFRLTRVALLSRRKATLLTSGHTGAALPGPLRSTQFCRTRWRRYRDSPFRRSP